MSPSPERAQHPLSVVSPVPMALLLPSFSMICACPSHFATLIWEFFFLKHFEFLLSGCNPELKHIFAN